MLTREERLNVVQELIGTAEAMGQAMSPNAAAVIVGDLEGIPVPVIKAALRSVRSTYKGRLTFQVIRERILQADGRPEGNEAWAIALQAADERESVVWTAEIQSAFDSARPILRVGDKIGARMAFLSAYERQVQAARDAGTAATWLLSMGWDAQGRNAALEKAVQQQLIPHERALQLGYEPPLQLTGPEQQGVKAITGLVTGEKVEESSLPPGMSERLSALREEVKASSQRRAEEKARANEELRRQFQDRKDTMQRSVECYQAAQELKRRAGDGRSKAGLEK